MKILVIGSHFNEGLTAAYLVSHLHSLSESTILVSRKQHIESLPPALPNPAEIISYPKYIEYNPSIKEEKNFITGKTLPRKKKKIKCLKKLNFLILIKKQKNFTQNKWFF